MKNKLRKRPIAVKILFALLITAVVLFVAYWLWVLVSYKPFSPRTPFGTIKQNITYLHDYNQSQHAEGRYPEGFFSFKKKVYYGGCMHGANNCVLVRVPKVRTDEFEVLSGLIGKGSESYYVVDNKNFNFNVTRHDPFLSPLFAVNTHKAHVSLWRSQGTVDGREELVFFDPGGPTVDEPTQDLRLLAFSPHFTFQEHVGPRFGFSEANVGTWQVSQDAKSRTGTLITLTYAGTDRQEHYYIEELTPEKLVLISVEE